MATNSSPHTPVLFHPTFLGLPVPTQRFARSGVRHRECVSTAAFLAGSLGKTPYVDPVRPTGQGHAQTPPCAASELRILVKPRRHPVSGGPKNRQPASCLIIRGN